MAKYLITGFSGFVAQHFLDHLENTQHKAKVYGLDVCSPNINKKYKNIDWEYKQVDLLNKRDIEALILKFQPEYILHLASFSSVAFSWQNPVSSFMNNTNIFLNILEVVRECNIQCRVLSIGSSEEYGNVTPDKVPLKETSLLDPISPYAVARVSQEMLSKVYTKGYGLDIVITRSFNHIGPGQKETFVISSFAKQIVSLKKQGQTKGSINVGNVSIIRDFLDVRDVVIAYQKLFEKGLNGEVYNICSGNGVSLEEVIKLLAEINKIDIQVIVDKKLLRPTDNQIIIGDNAKILKHTQWRPEISLKQSLIDISQYWSDNL